MMLRGLLVLLALACVAGGAAISACYTHGCDAMTHEYTQGVLVSTRDGYAVETSPLQSSSMKEWWVDFPGQATLQFTYPQPVRDALDGCTFLDVSTQIGTTSQPNDDDGAIFTPNAGQTAQFSDVTTHGFSVLNGSCADYSARFVVYYACPAASPEAGTDAAGE